MVEEKRGTDVNKELRCGFRTKHTALQSQSNFAWCFSWQTCFIPAKTLIPKETDIIGINLCLKLRIIFITFIFSLKLGTRHWKLYLYGEF